MSRACREFGISRPTGYKIFKRYNDLATRVTGSQTALITVVPQRLLGAPAHRRSRVFGAACEDLARSFADGRVPATL